MPTIHWAGTGLSATPGLRALIRAGHRVRVYNRSVDKARDVVAGLPGDVTVQRFELPVLEAALQAGDVVVSMLPADLHVALAQCCLAHDAHFVSSSYIAPAMQALDGAARAKGCCLVNEVGLDPGIDHSMAHALVADYKASAVFDRANVHSFTSYCGGLSKTPNAFRYKFSWSPLGVLRALKSPSVSIRKGADYQVTKPWTAVENFPLDMPWGAETFEVYPNRDSRPFLAQYHFGPDWNVREFVRGTLRYQGWKQAWQPIFERIERGMSDAELSSLSQTLWQQHALEPGEPDRVVLAVSLKAEKDGKAVWYQSYLLDAFGHAEGSAMARLVSMPVALAVEAVLKGEIAPGVSAAPDQPELVQRWLARVGEIADHLARVDHLAA
ncbi:MAG TPA: saccharopine dehydrogenase NADP-binding domain-containing protein [Thiolinea sp.]|nr:saccharopine dehydrogenase NADP-binding domain-containing protein [Thiolinea sp.]